MQSEKCLLYKNLHKKGVAFLAFWLPQYFNFSHLGYISKSHFLKLTFKTVLQVTNVIFPYIQLYKKVVFQVTCCTTGGPLCHLEARVGQQEALHLFK
jgi:hypothetical protein